MSYRKENFVENEYYHLYNRGNSKQDIFIDDFDRDRFIKLLYLCNSEKKINFRDDIVEPKINAFDFDRGESLVSVGSWVVMPNHFHIYVTPRQCLGVSSTEDDNLVGNFVHKLCTSYSMYFNRKYKRTGKLFEGSFKSVHIESDEQAKYLFSYIHLNPIKLIDQLWKENGIKDIQKTKAFLDSYAWSSYLDYKGIVRPENNIISSKNFPDYFSDVSVLEREIFDWLDYGDNLPLGNA